MADLNRENHGRTNQSMTCQCMEGVAIRLATPYLCNAHISVTFPHTTENRDTRLRKVILLGRWGKGQGAPDG